MMMMTVIMDGLTDRLTRTKEVATWTRQSETSASKQGGKTGGKTEETTKRKTRKSTSGSKGKRQRGR